MPVSLASAILVLSAISVPRPQSQLENEQHKSITVLNRHLDTMGQRARHQICCLGNT